MKKYYYVCIFLIAVILVLLFYPRRQIETFDSSQCQVSAGDKKAGFDLRVDQSCITKGGGLGCQPGKDGKPNGCRFCSLNPNNKVYPPCPDAPTDTCTKEGQDPFSQCPSGQYVGCCDGLDISYVNDKLQCVKSGSTPQPPPPLPSDKCAGITCPHGQTCDPNTGKCSDGPPQPSGTCSDPSDSCKNHIDYIKAHINDYLKNGLKPEDAKSPLLQQYLYSCEIDVCSCNPEYGSNKQVSISKFGWNCHPDKCSGVKCPSGQTCDPNTGNCSGHHPPPK